MDIGCILMVSALIYFAIEVYKYYKSNQRIHKCLDVFPGDTYWPVIGSTWRLIGLKREDSHEFLKGIFNEFGPIWRQYIGDIPVLFTSKVEYIEVILKDTVNITKGEAYRFVKPWLGDGLITAKGELWRKNRRLLNAAFHLKILDKYHEVFLAKAEELLNILKEKASQNYIDIFPYLTRWGLDIITETAMGVKFNCLKNPDSEYAVAIFKLCELFVERMKNPWLLNDFIFFKLSRQGKLYKKYLEVIKNTNLKIIADRRSEFKKNIIKKVDDLGRKEKIALLDILLENQEDNKLTDEEMCDEVSTFMFAGQDTTASTVAFALLAIGSHPDVQSKIHQELDSILLDEKKHATPQNIADMDYLERVIRETLRMFASVPQISRKLEQDIMLDGHIIPAGVDVQLCLNQMQHDPEHWPQPYVFDPDRFLPENSVGRHPYAFSAFSGGMRNCIGQKFGTRNAKTVLATILRDFEVSSLETVTSIKLFEEIVLRPQVGPHIKLKARK